MHAEGGAAEVVQNLGYVVVLVGQGTDHFIGAHIVAGKLVLLVGKEHQYPGAGVVVHAHVVAVVILLVPESVFIVGFGKVGNSQGINYKADIICI